MAYFDEDGNPVEGLVKQEELQKLQDEKLKVEQTLNEELEKLKKKDFNFRKLEEMTEEEKKKLTATELELKKQQEELAKQQQDFQENFVKEIKNDILDELAGEDKEMREKIESNMSRIKDSDTAKTRSELKRLMLEAYNMTGASKTFRNPIHAASNYTSNSSDRTNKRAFSESEEGHELAKRIGLSYINSKKE